MLQRVRRDVKNGKSGKLMQVLRFITITLFSSVILLVNAQFGLQVAFYEIFKPALIEQYCVNKLQPESDCEGSCHMSELAQGKTDGKQATLPESTPEFKVKFQEFSFHLSEYIHPQPQELPIHTKGNSLDLLSHQFLSEVPEAPPRV